MALIKYKIPNRMLLLASLFFSVTSAWGLSTDKEQIIEIQADSSEFDNAIGMIIYQGNILVTQGSILLHADSLTAHLKDGKILTFTAQGKPAKFRQLPDNSDTYDEAEATTITYDRGKNLTVLMGNASIKQAQLSVYGEYIEYNTTLSKISAHSDDVQQDSRVDTDTDDTPKKRVRIIYDPKNQEKE